MSSLVKRLKQKARDVAEGRALSPGNPLSERLASIRRDKAAGKKRERKLTSFGKVGESEYQTLADGRRIELPSIYGLNWLRLTAEALRLQGICYAARVSTEHFERDGSVSLWLQRVVHKEQSAPTVSLVGGARSLRSETQKLVLGGGLWDRWRVPIGLVNNHDTRSLIKLLLAPKDHDLVFSRNQLIQAMHGR